ncbi:sulfite exporter TauE/SafE family protein [Salinimonas sp. HHU 13199]|uniref:Probable membrane transporter protein n=1 Tax=Salinimonas profundi TaxID=2729140 RepID=A0ABR8LJR5_9ALTE|nr:sulfite exporter TauE/SafE family protein [Salinimonas profundi]MBD3585570.1 sulfite exporter TauE/SafE family protein [Salinimonas profundi]
MIDLLTAGGISAVSVLLLVATSFITALFTATLGVGGGVLLLAVMASVVPVQVLIPLHGLVQFGANGNRALMTIRHLDKPVFFYFLAGAVFGAILASFIVVRLPLLVIQFAVAAFILLLLWGPNPKPRPRNTSHRGNIVTGAVTTLIAMFVGAAGPLVAAFIHRKYDDKLTLTATFAACMTMQHALKAIVFSTIGFAVYQWLPLITLMIASGAAGTWLGLKMLVRLPTHHFKTAFKWIVTLLAIRLLYDAFSTLLD